MACRILWNRNVGTFSRETLKLSRCWTCDTREFRAGKIFSEKKCDTCRTYHTAATVHHLRQKAVGAPSLCGLQPSRRFWGMLNSVFNRYDQSRVEEVGANRACAEWLLRCGASIRWDQQDSFLKDYNSLPVGGPRRVIAEVDATDSAIMNIGFEHFRGCKGIRRVVLHRATYVDDDALNQLHYLQHSLRELQVSACGSVTADGLKQLANLSNLENLLLYDFPEVKDKTAVVEHLQQHLPKCKVIFTYASDAEQQQLEKDKQDDKPTPDK